MWMDGLLAAWQATPRGLGNRVKKDTMGAGDRLRLELPARGLHYSVIIILQDRLLDSKVERRKRGAGEQRNPNMGGTGSSPPLGLMHVDGFGKNGNRHTPRCHWVSCMGTVVLLRLIQYEYLLVSWETGTNLCKCPGRLTPQFTTDLTGMMSQPRRPPPFSSSV